MTFTIRYCICVFLILIFYVFLLNIEMSTESCNFSLIFHGIVYFITNNHYQILRRRIIFAYASIWLESPLTNNNHSTCLCNRNGLLLTHCPQIKYLSTSVTPRCRKPELSDSSKLFAHANGQTILPDFYNHLVWQLSVVLNRASIPVRLFKLFQNMQLALHGYLPNRDISVKPRCESCRQRGLKPLKP